MMDPVTAFAGGVPAFVAATFATADVVSRSPAATVFAPMLIRAGPDRTTGTGAPTGNVTAGFCVDNESDGVFSPTTPRTVWSLTVVVVVMLAPVTSAANTMTSPGRSVAPLLLL